MHRAGLVTFSQSPGSFPIEVRGRRPLGRILLKSRREHLRCERAAVGGDLPQRRRLVGNLSPSQRRTPSKAAKKLADCALSLSLSYLQVKPAGVVSGPRRTRVEHVQ